MKRVLTVFALVAGLSLANAQEIRQGQGNQDQNQQGQGRQQGELQQGQDDQTDQNRQGQGTQGQGIQGQGTQGTQGQGMQQGQEIKEAEVPSAVKQGFNKKYPDVKVERWEKSGNNYEAEFRKNTMENSVTVDASGKVVESKMAINVSELPEKINTYFSENLQGKKADEAWKVTDADGKTVYKARVGNEKYVFSSDGTFIKKKDAREMHDKDKKGTDHKMHHDDGADMKKDY